MRISLLIAGMMFVFVLFSECQAAELTVDEILAKVEKANCPDGAIAKVKTEVMTSKVKNEAGKEGTLVMKMKFPDKMRIEVEGGKDEKLVRAFNGSKGWQFSNKTGLREITGKELDGMRFQTALFAPDTNFKTIFEKVVIEKADDSVNKQPCYKLTCTPLPKFNMEPLTMYVDKNTFLVAKTIEKHFIDDKAIDIIKVFDDYKDIEGVMVPMSMVSDIGGKVIDVTVESVTWNDDIHDSYFDMPEQL